MQLAPLHPGGEALAAALVKEALAVSLTKMPTGAAGILTKAYIGALAKLAAAVPLRAAASITDPEAGQLDPSADSPRVDPRLTGD
jgi:hypothetical protein